MNHGPGITQPAGTDLEKELTTCKFQKPFTEIMGAIEEYHTRLGYPRKNASNAMRIKMHNDFCLALNAEVTELLDAVPWKPWRPNNYKPVDKVNIMEEIVDIIFFLTSISEVWDLDYGRIGDMLERKLIENNRRIDNGYSKPSDQM